MVGEWRVLSVDSNRLVLGQGDEQRTFEIFGAGARRHGPQARAAQRQTQAERDGPERPANLAADVPTRGADVPAGSAEGRHITEGNPGPAQRDSAARLVRLGRERVAGRDHDRLTNWRRRTMHRTPAMRRSRMGLTRRMTRRPPIRGPISNNRNRAATSGRRWEWARRCQKKRTRRQDAKRGTRSGLHADRAAGGAGDPGPARGLGRAARDWVPGWCQVRHGRDCRSRISSRRWISTVWTLAAIRRHSRASGHWCEPRQRARLEGALHRQPQPAGRSVGQPVHSTSGRASMGRTICRRWARTRRRAVAVRRPMSTSWSR